MTCRSLCVFHSMSDCRLTVVHPHMVTVVTWTHSAHPYDFLNHSEDKSYIEDGVGSKDKLKMQHCSTGSRIGSQWSVSSANPPLSLSLTA